MTEKTKNNLLALGFDTDLIKKIAEKSLTISNLKTFKHTALLKQGFTEDETTLILRKLERKPIQKDVQKSILFKSGEICCFCADGNSSLPYHIHHIEEHHISQNNSEENLLLVCPNHHDDIHKKKIPLEIQKATKRSWENIWLIAQNYKAEGINFPFRIIETIDYSNNGSITEIFLFDSPTGSVCVELAKGKLAEECLKILNKENNLILAGSSGSGKTTLAKGLAGCFQNVIVYKYIASSKESSAKNAQEVMTFLSFNRQEIILIIDDANKNFETEHLRKILRCATPQKKILVVNTRNTFVDETNLETHFGNSVQHVSWNVLNDSVTTSIIKNEKIIVDFLNKNNINDFSGLNVGLGRLDYPLESLVANYMKSTKSVWEFMYMLGTGSKRITSIYNELYSKDRFDIVFLYISIKQISKVEDGVNANEISSLFKRNQVLSRLTEPDKEWIEEQLEDLSKQRRLVKACGKYKTVHREFAKNFVINSFKENENECSELLDEVFNELENSKEIIILWSWLRDSEVCKYVNNWINSLNDKKWETLIRNSANHGLGIVSLLSKTFHHHFLRYNSSHVKNAFLSNVDSVAHLINKGGEGTMYYFNEIMVTLKYHCNEMIIPLMDRIPTDHFAAMTKKADCEEFFYISNLFNTISFEHFEWVENFRRNFSFTDLESILRRNKKGKIGSTLTIIGVYRTYISDIKRSEFRTCVEIISKQLSGCDLHEISCSPELILNMLELQALPNEIDLIMESLDFKRMAKSFEKSVPRNWGNLSTLCRISQYSNSKFARDFIDSLSIDDTIFNISKYCNHNLHEFKIILHQLAFGSDNTRKKFAEKLKTVVDNIVEKQQSLNTQGIMEAYYNLDSKLATEIYKKQNIPLPNDKGLGLSDFSEMKIEFEKRDMLQEDYIISGFLVGRQ
ncbi:ATP-binding protein [Chryseobacterium sp. 18068]|uniref:ATP-binding protein n=1 Tax=Chryseobacterium sp. 18068 TaxID=2681414 RepID=UPI00135CCF6A|nr:ATP-binding protein [Chryseobacterium sp. 18068]